MNHMNERKKSGRRGRKPSSKKKDVLRSDWERLISEQLGFRDRYIAEWKEAKTRNESTLSLHQIEFLGRLAEMNLRNIDGKAGLTNNDSKEKGYIRATLRGAIADLDRMASHGFIGATGPTAHFWNPCSYNNSVNRPLFDPDKLKEDLPVHKIASFVEALVGMYGDEYAIPLANAIRKGLVDREPWGNYEVRVSIVREARS